jgi:hypothetical protein
MALKLIACVLLLEITTFLRECYRTLPKPQTFGHHQQHRTATGVKTTVFTFDTSGKGGITGGPAGGGPLQSSSGRRWSMATQSIAGSIAPAPLTAPVTSTSGEVSVTTPTSASISVGGIGAPSAGLPVAEGGIVGGAPRKISFVLQEDINVVNGSQTTLAVQVRKRKRKRKEDGKMEDAKGNVIESESRRRVRASERASEQGPFPSFFRMH